MNARRLRNVGKIVAVALIDQYLSDGCEPDEQLAVALNDVKVGILNSMSDRVYDQAEKDWQTYVRGRHAMTADRRPEIERLRCMDVEP